MDQMKERIGHFLNYGAYADTLKDNDEFWKEKKRVTDEAMKLCSKKDYRKLFREMDYEGKSLLNHALSKKMDLIPRLLIDYFEADPTSANDHWGRTSMHYVCEVGHMSWLKEFIHIKRHQVEYNVKDKTGLIPLHLAILNGHAKIAYKMLKRVACVENHDLFFGRSIHAAAFMDQVSVIQRILRRFPKEASIVISGFCTPHVCALYGDSLYCLTFLWLYCPMGPDDKLVSKAVAYTDSESTALKSVTILLYNGANANSFDEDLCEELAILVAAKKRWLDLVRLLRQRTTPVAGVEWTVEGIIGYVETDAFRQLDEERAFDKVERLTGRIIQELGRNNVLPAMIICHSLRSNLDEITYKRFHSLCKFFWELGKTSATRIEVDAPALHAYAYVLRSEGHYHLALLAADGSLALDPDGCLSFREELVGMMAGVRISG